MEELIAELKAKIVAGLALEGVAPGDIDPDKPLFVEGLGLDSIDAVELVVILERDFGIRLKDMETAKAAFKSLRSLAEFIVGRRQGSA
jgi:acyl carrier protein